MQLIAKDNSFVCLHGKQQLVSTLSRNPQHTCLHGEQLKITLVHTVTHNIILNTHIVIHKGFFGLSGPGKGRQGIGLWDFSKLIGCLLFKRRIDRKPCRIYASFENFSKSVTYPCQIPAILLRLLTDFRSFFAKSAKS